MIGLPEKAKTIITTLKNRKFEAYAVGGSVRDVLMGKPTKGWDYTTNATPEQILEIFPDSFYDNAFGTVGIKIKGESSEETVDIYEITTYRNENGYTDHRHPDKIAWGSSLTEDLSRRDFTINAIAFDGETLVDPYNGQKDLGDKLIRAVGNPTERFGEDALRAMRAIRIAAELGFTIDDITLAAIKNSAHLITTISFERIRDELLRILASQFAADAILLLKNTGLLAQILPELEEAFIVGQKSPKRHHIYDVGTHSVLAMRHCPSTDPIIRFATLIHDIGKPKTVRKDESGIITFYNHEVVGSKIAKDICYRLRFSKKQTEKIVTLVRWHQFTVDERQTDSALRRFICHVGKDFLDDMLALRIGDRLGGGARETSWRLELFKKRLEEVQKQPFTVADLAVDGHDVMKEFNCKPSKLVGEILDRLFAQVEEGTLPNVRDALLKKIEELKSTASFSTSPTR